MKKNIILLVILILSIFLRISYSNTIKDNTFTVATLPDFPPFGSYDKNGKLVGFDIDLSNLIASKLNKKVSFKEMPFDTMFVALQKNQIDSIIYAVTITPERKKMVNFSDPYFEDETVFIVRNDYNEINKLKDLKDKTIGVELGSSQDSSVEKDFKDSKNIKYKSVANALLNLKAKKVDVVLADRTNASILLKDNKNLKIVKNLSIDKSDIGIAISKDNKELLKQINSILKEIKKNGELDKLKVKWNLL